MVDQILARNIEIVQIERHLLEDLELIGNEPFGNLTVLITRHLHNKTQIIDNSLNFITLNEIDKRIQNEYEIMVHCYIFCIEIDSKNVIKKKKKLIDQKNNLICVARLWIFYFIMNYQSCMILSTQMRGYRHMFS